VRPSAVFLPSGSVYPANQWLGTRRSTKRGRSGAHCGTHAPASGQWGNAGRNSITGPAQFSLNASAGRTFRWGDRLTADLRVDASNALNHPVFPSWNTVIGSAQFGLPNPAGAMRTLQTTLRVRF